MTRQEAVTAMFAARKEYNEARTSRAWRVYRRLQQRLGLYGCPFTGNYQTDVTPATDRSRSRHETERPRTPWFAYY